jgi:2-C-methyl-D-erythritol 4-phosphate cytidylyltransferase
LTTAEFALIVAGGKGTRINSSLPKQFLDLNGTPVLVHTINAFRRYSEKIKVVLVLPADDMDTWKKTCAGYLTGFPVLILSGGDSRFQSVRRGLEKIEGDGLVAIHDGVRPLVSEDIIAASFRQAAVHGSAVASVRLKDSVRMTDKDGTHALDRSHYRLIQTPQTFRLDLIRKAYSIPEDVALTDDASVAERAGHKISLFEGSYRNIKITTPEDLTIAEALMVNSSQDVKTKKAD